MNLNENASSVLLNGHDDSDEDGETASNDGPAKSADMDADLSALLASAGKDNNNEVMPGGRRPLEGIRAGLNCKQDLSVPSRRTGGHFFINLLSEKMGHEKLKAKLER